MSAAPSGVGGEVVLVDVVGDPLDAQAVLDAVADPAAGAIVSFTGAVRDNDHRDGADPALAEPAAVTGLEYSAHPTAVRVLGEVAAEIAARPGVIKVAGVHRVGRLDIGDLAVVLAVSTGHRGDAFDACRVFIDELKARVPIWKHQLFADGSDEWVGSP